MMALAQPNAARVQSIDVLRGVAVLGILLMNIRTFALPSDAYSRPNIAGVESPLDLMVFLTGHVLADAKFMAIFSFLFGVGVAIFTSRLESRTGRSGGMHYRRMGWLLLIGLCHGWLLWYGDILVAYALCGMIAFPFRHMRGRWLVVLGSILLFIGVIIPWGLVALVELEGPHAMAKMASDLAVTPESLAYERAAWTGSWADQWELRSQLTGMIESIGFLVFVMWRTIGLMLLGMACMRWKLFSPECSRRLLMGLFLGGLLIGPWMTWQGVVANRAVDWNSVDVMFRHAGWNYFGSLATAAAWVGLVLWWCQTDMLTMCRGWLAAVGRMALSNYLAQSVLCALIFYGYGLGFYGQFGYASQLLFVVGIWVIQLAWSPWWLNRFRFGPMEWLWRSLTYWKLQPLRRERVHSET